MHKLPQPVKLWYLAPLLPPRGAAGRAATASSGRSARRRSAPTTRPSTPSRSCCSPTLLERARACAGCACAWRASARPTRAPPTASELQAHLRAHEDRLSERGARAHRPQPAARVRQRPPRHARGHGVARRCCSTTSTPRTRALRRRCARCSTPPSIAYELDPTLVRGLDYYTRTVFEFTSRRARRAERRRRRRALRRPVEQLGGAADARAWAGRPGVERMLLAAERAAGAPPPSCDLYVASPSAERRAAAAFALAARGAPRRAARAQLELAGRSLKGQLKQADAPAAPGTLPCSATRGSS